MIEKKYYYSHIIDEEFWSNTEIESAIEDYGYTREENGDDDFETGDIITIYRGECQNYRASYFCVDITDDITNCAYDNCGECSEDWLNGREKELNEHIKKAIDEWCDKNNEQPKFGTMKNIVNLDVRILENGFEIVEKAKEEV